MNMTTGKSGQKGQQQLILAVLLADSNQAKVQTTFHLAFQAMILISMYGKENQTFIQIQKHMLLTFGSNLQKDKPFKDEIK